MNEQLQLQKSRAIVEALTPNRCWHGDWGHKIHNGGHLWSCGKCGLQQGTFEDKEPQANPNLFEDSALPLLFEYQEKLAEQGWYFSLRSFVARRFYEAKFEKYEPAYVVHVAEAATAQEAIAEALWRLVTQENVGENNG